MLTSIASFFESHFGVQEDQEDSYSPEQLQLASAALMIELCKADQSMEEVELQTLMTVLRERFELDETTLGELMELAHQEASEATSLYQFTSLMNEQFDYGEKVRMILNMWEVAYADGKIDRYEDHMIRKVADLLYVSHVDFISSKHKAREKAGL